MTNKDFYKMFEKLVKQEKEIMVGKGKEYTVGSDDKLQNFKDVARNSGLDPIKVWFIYTSKHWASICNYVKDGVEASNEPIDGRFMDMRNYLMLGLALIKEKNLISVNTNVIDDGKMSPYEFSKRCEFLASTLYSKSYKDLTDKQAAEVSKKVADGEDFDNKWEESGWD